MEINHFKKTDLEGSYIYFIFARELLYIGQTQKIAFFRWVNHLYNNGSLTKKINQFGDPYINYKINLNFISIKCISIRSDFPEIRWKTITQAVEHSVHSKLYSSQSSLIESYYNNYEPDVSEFKIISDTKSTAPSSIPVSEWNYANNYANELLLKLYEYLS